MKKTVNWLCAAAFVLVCALVFMFFAPLTETGGGIPLLAWESAELLDGGVATPFDPYTGLPGPEDGSLCRFTATLPEREEYMKLTLVGGDGESVLTLDGAELFAVRAGSYTASVSTTLPPGGGETIVLETRIASGRGVFPPSLQLEDELSAERDSIAYANYYAVPAGAMALIFVLLCGLFLLGIAEKRADWRLLLLIFAAAALTVPPLSKGLGAYFFTDAERSVFSWNGWDALAAIAIIAWLALHRSRRFWHLLGCIAAVSAAALLLAWGVSALRGGYLATYLPSLWSELRAGIYSNAVFWLTVWLVFVCALLSTWELVRAVMSARTEARSLELKNQLVLENYHAIEARLRDTAALRHEFAHRLTVMDAYLNAGDYDALAGCVSDWRCEGGGAQRALYTENIAVNAICQEAEGRAAQAGIEFAATVMTPRKLELPDADICALLMNMLDNALEGAERTPPGRKRFVRVQIRCAAGFLAVSCENSFDGRVLTDAHGELRSTKSEPENHGLGLAQMRAVAEKYSSILDLSWDEGQFKVQTALKLPEG